MPVVLVWSMENGEEWRTKIRTIFSMVILLLPPTLMLLLLAILGARIEGAADNGPANTIISERTDIAIMSFVALLPLLSKAIFLSFLSL